MTAANPWTSLRWLKVSIAVLLVLLAVAPFCSACPQRSLHRHPAVRQAAGTSREIAEVSPDLVIAPPPRCEVLELPAAAGWAPVSSDLQAHSPLAFPSLNSRAPPAR
jgi:hypothetical protein